MADWIGINLSQKQDACSTSNTREVEEMNIHGFVMLRMFFVFLLVTVIVTATDARSPVLDGSPTKYSGYNLPLMIIESHGQIIERSPRVVVDMGLIDNGKGMLNHPGDVPNVYSGKMGINRRGQSSYGFPKIQYRIELQNEDGTNNNVSILGLPRENDFVLYGPYLDKTLIKNVLTYELFGRTGHWSPRTRFIEVIFDGEYRGIYVLTEKLKRDRYRVDINPLGSEDNSWPSISGGYILKRDKTELSTPGAWWRSTVSQPYHNQMWYEYHDPKIENLSSEQASYIRNWMQRFDEMMSGSNFRDPVNGYKAHIDVESFIDMMFINEITKGIDNYNFSSYFFKDNDANGGLLSYGPPWDYNIGYGNVNYGQDWHASETYGWCYTQGGRIYWFRRLMEDAEFRNRVYCRWTYFRDGIFSDSNVLNTIDGFVDELGAAVDRNFSKYPILGVWINPELRPVPQTYREELANLEGWLLERLHWMDEQWYGRCQDESAQSDIGLIHYWHFNGLDGNTVTDVKSDYSRNGQGTITYQGNGLGYMDARTHRSGDPVSNINLLGGQKNNDGAVLRLRNPSSGRALVIKAPSSGYKDIQLTYATARTNNGPTHQSLYYSVNDGADWQMAENFNEVVLLPGWGARVFNFSGFAQVNNNANLQFKILLTGENTENTSGNNRFDNISIRGTALQPTGLAEPRLQARLSVWPNPAIEYLEFSVDNTGGVNGIVSIFNAGGRLVKQVSVSDYTSRILIDDLVPGIYILNFTNQLGSVKERFIKF